MEPRTRQGIVAVVAVTVVAAFAGWRGLHADHAISTDATHDTEASSRSRPSAAPVALAAVHLAPAGPSARLAPLPPPGSPLKPVYEDLKRRADAGDAAAASRLFNDIWRCSAASMQQATQPVVLQHAMDEDLSKLSAGELRQREAFLASVSDQFEKARAAQAVCDGLSEEQQQVTPFAYRAAQLGDVVAANCYVGGFPNLGKGLLAHPEWVNAYRDNALAIAETAVAHGDWSMVALLQYAYSPIDAFGMLNEMIGVDPARSYRYLRLERLGASEFVGAQLDRAIAVAERDLSPAQIADGASWAKETFQRYFAAHPERHAMRTPAVCPD